MEQERRFDESCLISFERMKKEADAVGVSIDPFLVPLAARTLSLNDFRALLLKDNKQTWMG